jgi:hypothetical protein
MIPIQASIVGYSGKPCTLFSAYDEDSQVLVVSVEADYRTQRRDGCMIITNNTDIDRDGLFTEDDLKDAINAFYGLHSGVANDGQSSRLVFSDKAARANPGNSIEKDGIDSSGQKFRISESITCAQIAALATCWYAHSRVGTVNKMLNMADELLAFEQLHHGVIFTI